MQQTTVGKTMLSPLSSGSCVSYELCGDEITVRFLGLLPIKKIQLADIRHLRLATRHETAPLVFFLNWLNFYFNRAAYLPIYMLQTRNGKCCFMKLDPSTFRMLKKARNRFQKSAFGSKKAA